MRITFDYFLGFLWKREPTGDQCAPHSFTKAATYNPILQRRTGLFCTAASRRRSRSFSPKCLRVHRFHRWPVDTDSPWCSPARCLREGESLAVLFSKSWTHLFNVSQGKFGLFLLKVFISCCCGAVLGPNDAFCNENLKESAQMRQRCCIFM